MANLIINGDFSSSTTGWTISLATGSTVTVVNPGISGSPSTAAQISAQTTIGAENTTLTQSITVANSTTYYVRYLVTLTSNIVWTSGGQPADFDPSIWFDFGAQTFNRFIDTGTPTVNQSNYPITAGTFYAVEQTIVSSQTGPINFTINTSPNGTHLFQITSVYVSTTPFCYNEGTQILCLKESGEEEYRAIENIRVGHLVKTYKHGAKAVTHIGKGEMLNSHADPRYSMYKLPKTGDMIDDLLVLGGHSILVDSFESEEVEKECATILGITPRLEDKCLLLAMSSPHFTKMPEGEKYTYYHLVLDNTGNEFVHYGIWANGVLSETCSKETFEHHNLIPLE